MEKVGRNDPCPCGSGKKYKSCCLQKAQQQGSFLTRRKFTAKVLTKNVSQKAQDETQAKAMIDYTTLMERSFGEALHSHEDKPPTPQNPSDYLMKNQSEEMKN